VATLHLGGVGAFTGSIRRDDLASQRHWGQAKIVGHHGAYGKPSRLSCKRASPEAPHPLANHEGLQGTLRLVVAGDECDTGLRLPTRGRMGSGGSLTI